MKQQLHSAQVAGQWRGDTALTLPLFWRRSTVSPVFFGRYPRSSLLSLVPSTPPPTPLSPSLISHLASVVVKQNGLGPLEQFCFAPCTYAYSWRQLAGGGPRPVGQRRSDGHSAVWQRRSDGHSAVWQRRSDGHSAVWQRRTCGEGGGSVGVCLGGLGVVAIIVFPSS